MDLTSLDVDPVKETSGRIPETSFAELVLAGNKGFVEGYLLGRHDEERVSGLRGLRGL